MMHDGHYYWGMHWIWWILWIIILFWIFAAFFGVRGRLKRTDNPLEILKKRFAKGEITKEEYEERKKTLESD